MPSHIAIHYCRLQSPYSKKEVFLDPLSLELHVYKALARRQFPNSRKNANGVGISSNDAASPSSLLDSMTANFNDSGRTKGDSNYTPEVLELLENFNNEVRFFPTPHVEKVGELPKASVNNYENKDVAASHNKPVTNGGGNYAENSKNSKHSKSASSSSSTNFNKTCQFFRRDNILCSLLPLKKGQSGIFSPLKTSDNTADNNNTAGDLSADGQTKKRKEAELRELILHSLRYEIGDAIRELFWEDSELFDKIVAPVVMATMPHYIAAKIFLWRRMPEDSSSRSSQNSRKKHPETLLKRIEDAFTALKELKEVFCVQTRISLYSVLSVLYLCEPYAKRNSLLKSLFSKLSDSGFGIEFCENFDAQFGLESNKMSSNTDLFGGLLSDRATWWEKPGMWADAVSFNPQSWTLWWFDVNRKTRRNDKDNNNDEALSLAGTEGRFVWLGCVAGLAALIIATGRTPIKIQAE